MPSGRTPIAIACTRRAARAIDKNGKNRRCGYKGVLARVRHTMSFIYDIGSSQRFKGFYLVSVVTEAEIKNECYSASVVS
jgi:hypothetical protein